ncbi:MAG TPA: fatty acyl-AMP ligase [Pyrinomonadaceae bacterium]|nr:fatty acyl-AMP ligase [Pyrinomonadaceae bacterium]
MRTNHFEPAEEFSSLMELLRWRAAAQPHQTLYTYLVDGEDEEISLTFSELDEESRAIAAHLQHVAQPGQRALLVFQPGLEYIKALYSCFYSGVVAVPVYPPHHNRHLSRVNAIIKNAEATLVLTTTAIMGGIVRQFAGASLLNELQWVTTDTVDKQLAREWHEWTPPETLPALLQYTSGSTGTPKGVVLTSKNLLQNSALIKRKFEHTSESRVVFWTPPYHDMGLIGGLLQPLYCGIPVTLLSPFSFLQRPLRWLQAISRTRATTSGGPNFAYDLCVQKITPDHKETLDLSSWDLAFCGAEPVRAETLQSFSSAFEQCGFRAQAFYPCYGLAEATLMVSGGEKKSLFVTRTIQATALAKSRVHEVGAGGENAVKVVGCGRAISGQTIKIVNPESLTECSSNEVGEIWVMGSSVASGYWNRPSESQETFNAYLESGEGPFLRTGDLGFLSDGELFVVGRLKDLIIIAGRNIHPQDIELTAERSHPALRPGCGAAFGIERDGEERLVVVNEVERRYRNLEIDKVVRSIRRAVAEEHQTQVHCVVLIKHGSIPKTSSGKIQRYACRSQFLAETLTVINDPVTTDVSGAAVKANSMAEAETQTSA